MAGCISFCWPRVREKTHEHPNHGSTERRNGEAARRRSPGGEEVQLADGSHAVGVREVGRRGGTENLIRRLESSSRAPRPFHYEQLRVATCDFSDKQLLGEGGFGRVYRGTLPSCDNAPEVPVAVKSISAMSSQGPKEFESEVTIISKVSHRNLVKLQGWCYEGPTAAGGERCLLVYDYMRNGSLDKLLHDDKECVAKLSWKRRHDILQGIGSALQYLHEECDNVILHRDLKCSNVMLDDNFNPKLGDFGLSRQVEEGMSSYVTTKAMGTWGYMAPEVVQTNRATKESDIFSFGAVLLEVACGRKPMVNIRDNPRGSRPNQAARGQGKPLVDWVRDLHRESMVLAAADKRLHGLYNLDEMTRVLVTGLACCDPDPKGRLTIKEAVGVLSGSTPMPVLVSALPITNCSAPRAIEEPTAEMFTANIASLNVLT